jgi:hypothetical protein
MEGEKLTLTAALHLEKIRMYQAGHDEATLSIFETNCNSIQQVCVFIFYLKKVGSISSHLLL